jgi:hypothetical protein
MRPTRAMMSSLPLVAGTSTDLPEPERADETDQDDVDAAPDRRGDADGTVRSASDRR